MLAVPVSPKSAIVALRDEVDRLVCLATPTPIQAVSVYYDDFEQTTDAEVIALLRQARGG